MPRITSQEILDAYHFRFACKEFDGDKKIPEELFEVILETGRLSPSSFGLEAWKFLVIQNPELREKIKELSWGAQSKLPEASHFMICLTRTEKDLNPFGSYIRDEIMRKTQDLPDELADPRAKRIAEYLKEDLQATTERNLRDWSAHQVYIPIGNMMTTAAMLGIDSCPIEGFNHSKIDELLASRSLLDQGRFTATCMIAFGYRKEDPQRPKSRRPLAEVVQWVK